MKLFESLKRLLEPRPRPPVETIGESTADRPPPQAAPSVEPAAPEVVAAIEVADDIPAQAPEAQAEIPPPAPEPASTSSSEPAPAAPRDALVLTLATPAATFTVAKTTVTIGRGEENMVRLNDLSVSRRHARIAWKQGGYWLSDLGSMGGTWVDGTRLNAPHRIATGEIIDIGLCRLTVSSAGGAAETDAKKSASRPRAELADSRRRR